MNDPAAAYATAEPEWPQQQEPEPGRVNRPARAVVAAVELVLAVVAGWGATLCWSNTTTEIVYQAGDGSELVSRIYSGPWIAAAIGVALVAALLVVDMARELALALRTRQKRG